MRQGSNTSVSGVNTSIHLHAYLLTCILSKMCDLFDHELQFSLSYSYFEMDYVKELNHFILHPLRDTKVKKIVQMFYNFFFLMSELQHLFFHVSHQHI